jgi:hypothetical protein
MSCLKAASSILSFSEVDRTPRVPFQAGIKELFRVFDGGSAKEGELYDLLIRFAGADAAVMGPDRGSRVRCLHPFPLFLDVGVSVVDELTDLREGLAAPVRKVLDLFVDECRGRFCWDGLFHMQLQLSNRILACPQHCAALRLRDTASLGPLK